MLSEILNKKINKVKKLEEEIMILLEKVESIFVKDENVHVKKILLGIKHLTILSKELSNNKNLDSMANKILVYNDSNNVNILLQIINDNFNKILDKKVNVETFLSQTYITETREYNQKIQLLFAKVKNDIMQIDEELLTHIGESICAEILSGKPEDINKYFQEFTEMIEKSTESIRLYKLVSNTLLDTVSKQNIQQSYELMNIIELSKNALLSNINKKSALYSYKNINPFIKNFGLINTSELLTLKEISNLLFHKDVSTMKDLTNICKEKEYDVVLIKKILNRGISYNILPLLDYSESKAFEQHHSQDDGISEEILDRYKTIEYISDSFIKWEIEYKYVYENKENKFALILEELHPNKYCILSNKLEPSKENRVHFVRKSNAREFLQFVKSQNYNPTRVNNYNEIINEKIINNMFLYVKPDVDSLKVKSQIIDPKYLRNEIYVLILVKFKKLFEKKVVKNIYEFSTIVHNEELGKIFSQVIMNEYYKYLFKNAVVYETENISMSEIYSSFLFVINIYERDFKKKIHDTFLNKIPKKEIFSDSKKDVRLVELFEQLLNEVLHSIITNENNIFQTIIYKLYLFKLSLLD
jgi:hypothetical protein